MASVTKITGAVLYDTLVNYLVSMSRTVEGAMNRALDALVNVDGSRTADLPGEVFLLEPRINEMEVVIDEHAIRLLRQCSFNDDEMRLIVAALKITNDLERIGDLAVNLAQCVISLREMPKIAAIEEFGADGRGGAQHGGQKPGSVNFQECGDGFAGAGERRCRGSISRP